MNQENGMGKGCDSSKLIYSQVKHKPDKTGFTKSILECVCADNDLQIT
jgi:hypothetical protein